MAAVEAFWLTGWDTTPVLLEVHGSAAIPWAKWRKERQRKQEEELFLLLLEEV